MKKRKLFKTGLITGALALVLAGCGGLSPKEEYSEAYEEINDAKTIDVDTNVQIEMDGEALGLSTEEENLLNSLEMNANIKSDIEQDQHEALIGIGANAGPIQLNLEIPLFYEGETDKVYTKAEGFVDMVSSIAMLSGFPMNIEAPEEVHGKVIEFPNDEVNSLTGEQEEAALEDLARQSREFLADLTEDAFTKEEDTISYTVSGEELVDEVYTLMTSNPLFAETGPADVSEFEEATSFGDVKVNAVMSDGSVASETMEIPITISNGFGESFDMTWHVSNTYNQVNGELEFTFDLSEENVMTEAEFDKVMNESMPGF